MDNWRLISIKYPFMDIYCLWISIAECPCMDIRTWISMWISTLVWIIEDWHPKIMDIHVDIRGFLEIHAWICYGFSDQGILTMRSWLCCINKTFLDEASANHNCCGDNFTYYADNCNCCGRNSQCIVTMEIFTTILVSWGFINKSFVAAAKLFSPCGLSKWSAHSPYKSSQRVKNRLGIRYTSCRMPVRYGWCYHPMFTLRYTIPRGWVSPRYKFLG